MLKLKHNCPRCGAEQGDVTLKRHVNRVQRCLQCKQTYDYYSLFDYNLNCDHNNLVIKSNGLSKWLRCETCFKFEIAKAPCHLGGKVHLLKENKCVYCGAIG